MFERIVFLHPDLGIGGAERLVVDAALAVQQKGYLVQMVTNHHDRSHCFEETLTPEVNVTVVGDWLPRSCFGRMMALFAYMRMLFAALYVILTCSRSKDLIFVDQISAPLPLFWLFGFKTVFYCHFPDQLLTNREHFLKRLYRLPIDRLEEWSTGFADQLLANSQFTASVIRQTFSSLRNRELQILYPVSNTTSLRLPNSVLSLDQTDELCGDRTLCRKMLTDRSIPSTARFVFVSLNRYERKKNLQLALFALSHLSTNWNVLIDAEDSDGTHFSDVHLIIAGGYDSRVTENVEYHEDLVALSEELKISDQVTFIRSCSSEVKALLIASSDAVVYTPDREHFGIVPIEAMAMSRPVIALDSGGPHETIVHGATGYLCPTDSVARLPQLVAECMARFINDNKLVSRMGQAARLHVSRNFSFDTFTTRLIDILAKIET